MIQEAARAGASERRPFALLMTDIVDSTELTVSLGAAAMADLWVKHDRVARTLLSEWRGREIDRSDGFLLLFEAAADAVAFALRYHRALASLPVPLPNEPLTLNSRRTSDGRRPASSAARSIAAFIAGRSARSA